MNSTSKFKLHDQAKIAVIGGGPAGSFFSFFLLDLARKYDLKLQLDIYESKDFTVCGPKGCNHCGGIVSESLMQYMSSEGILIPDKVLQRGIDSYVMHTDVGSTRIATPLQEKRIAAIYRGAGPLNADDADWESFDDYLQEMTEEIGARVIRQAVNEVTLDEEGYPLVTPRQGETQRYDFVVGAGGLKKSFFDMFEKLGFGYQRPHSTKTSISEFHLGHETVQQYFGSSMHVFLLDIPRLKFAAIIPKGDYVTMALLGEKIDTELLESFLSTPEVKKCFPEDFDLKGKACRCFAEINTKSAILPYADRIVLIGDCATSKLYKNGIGAAYMTAKAAATTAILHGISKQDFEKNYWPVCKKLEADNKIGGIVFGVTKIIQKVGLLKRGILRTVQKEQKKEGLKRHMSMVLWDTFTGSAPYKDIFMRTLHPMALFNFIWETLKGIILPAKKESFQQTAPQEKQFIGKTYQNGEVIIQQGDVGECMYVIQKGKVDVIKNEGGQEFFLAELGKGEFFGEMAVFESELRSTTIKANGEVRVMTIDKRTLFRRIQEDPSLAFRMLQKMSSRLRASSNTAFYSVSQSNCSS